jgi:hypothetical protein
MGGLLIGRKALLALLTVLSYTESALAQSVPPGGAPPLGSGNIDHQGFVRVIEGDTVELRIGESLVGWASSVSKRLWEIRSAANRRRKR